MSVLRRDDDSDVEPPLISPAASRRAIIGMLICAALVVAALWVL